MRQILRYEWQIAQSFLMFMLIFIPGGLYLKVYDFYSLMVVAAGYMVVGAITGFNDSVYLYCLPVKKRDVILGKYLFSGLMQVIIWLVAYGISFVFARLEWCQLPSLNTMMLGIGGSVLINSFPIYLSLKAFKGGTMPLYLQIVTIGVFIGIMVTLAFRESLLAHYPRVGYGFMALGLLLTLISLGLSLWDLKRGAI